jgi:hypothetical protein
VLQLVTVDITHYLEKSGLGFHNTACPALDIIVFDDVIIVQMPGTLFQPVSAGKT